MKNNKAKYFVAGLIILFLCLISLVLFIISREQKISFEEKIINYMISTAPIKTDIKESKIEEIFTSNLSKDKSYAVVIRNLNTGEEYSFNENEEFNSASLYKLWVLAVAMQQVKEGIIDPDEIISGDKNKFDETLGLLSPVPSTENATEENTEIEPVYISMKVSDAMYKMITESDNYAALLLTQKVGYKNVDSFLVEYGFTSSNFDSPPKTTVEDIAAFYEKLYEGVIIDKKASDEMLEILIDQTLNDRIPKYLPEEIKIAHKTGELFGAKHDAGIVFAPNGDYLIIVLSQTESEAIAAEKIAKFSKDIYDYFSKED